MSIFPISGAQFTSGRQRGWLGALVWLLISLASGGVMQVAWGGESKSANALRMRYTELSPQLNNNAFKKPIYLESADSANQLNAEIYALVDYPFSVVNAALNKPEHWCDVLVLHLNTKACQVSNAKAGTVLEVSTVKKYDQPADQAYHLEFSYSLISSTPEYFDVRLSAPSGPLGTSDYRIAFEAVAIQDGKTFVHLTYSFAYNFFGRMAMQAYVVTAGSGKVGFTRVEPSTDKPPDYISGMRAVVERNAMRYYLAVEAYLNALATPASEQFEKRLQNWFTAIEQYPLQLHDMDRSSYLEMKRREHPDLQKSG